MSNEFHAGLLIAEVLQSHGVRFVFTLCGGHISPILVGCKQRGLRVIDVRDEATTVFAADAVARLSGVPGVAVVTAGPGVTNTVTAVKNAQMAQSPVIVIGGATATVLKGRGSLQDIDQFALMKPHVKWATSVRRVRDVVPTLRRAFATAQSDVPGPVFIEFPLDVLYPPSAVRQWYDLADATGAKNLRHVLTRWYLERHVRRMFAHARDAFEMTPLPVSVPSHASSRLQTAADWLSAAARPVLLIGSQATLNAREIMPLQEAVATLGIPTYLGGMARGLLGRQHPLQFRHRRKQALKEADLVILAGIPMDFRLNYGRDFSGRTRLISINRSGAELRQNRRPDLAIRGDPGNVLRALAASVRAQAARDAWLQTLRARETEREREIDREAQPTAGAINMVRLCRRLEETIADDSIIIGDGGDFVATASYIVKPRAPLTWLDPGAFGTLGAGAGFALGAKLCHPQAEVWILYGDGSVGYSLAEFDTFVRHRIAVIGVVGNDASWRQIAREQVEMLHDDVGTVLRHADYHRVAQGFDAEGLCLRTDEEIVPGLKRAQQLASEGNPVLINAVYPPTDFRKGSLSM
jgi:thiamine pyrophosphate-dependent acetolactate synthase large subunit-like protein